jgi:hypothetical protein
MVVRERLRDVSARLGLTEDDRRPDAEAAFQVANDLDGNERAAGAERSERRDVPFTERGMVDHVLEHRRNADGVRGPLGLEQLELHSGIELGDEHVRRQGLHDHEHERLAAYVVQRDRVDVDVAGADTEPPATEPGSVAEPAVRQHRALRRSGRPRREHELGDVVRTGRR